MLAHVLLALGLVLVIEGLLYALVPGQLKAMMQSVGKLSDDRLRLGGLAHVPVRWTHLTGKNMRQIKSVRMFRSGGLT